MNRCPKLFVLYVLNCTVSKLHFGDSSLFPLKRFLQLRPTTGRQGKTKKYRESKTSAHKECWVRLLKINNPPPIIYSK